MMSDFYLATVNTEEFTTNQDIEQVLEYVDEYDKLSRLHMILQESKGTVISKPFIIII